MKKKMLIFLICFMQLSTLLTSEEKMSAKRITMYDKMYWADRLVRGETEIDLFELWIGCPASKAVAVFMIGNSGFSNDDVAKLLKRMYLEIYDYKDALSVNSAAEYMYYCLLKSTQEKYGSLYASQLKEFELDNIEIEDGIKEYWYPYKFPE